jgi:hypothetical protein
MTKAFLVTLSVAAAVTAAIGAHRLTVHAEAGAFSSSKGPPALLHSQARSSSSDPAILGVFEGRTPCGAVALEFTGFPAEDCENRGVARQGLESRFQEGGPIKWRLTLYRGSDPTRSGTFSFKGTRATRQGTWTSIRGIASDPNAVAYRLHPEGHHQPISFLKADENILLLLDRDLRLMVGDASWSYTLSRTDRIPQGRRP